MPTTVRCIIRSIGWSSIFDAPNICTQSGFFFKSSSSSSSRQQHLSTQHTHTLADRQFGACANQKSNLRQQRHRMQAGSHVLPSVFLCALSLSLCSASPLPPFPFPSCSALFFSLCFSLFSLSKPKKKQARSISNRHDASRAAAAASKAQSLGC